ncbi:MAG TPA: hypothetical protein PLC52_03345 [Anaerolineales bacterium]|nr:hypothetical protein [Anaerolineales bacterium]HRQ91884.1 hypothetical protein [Anaerolineales bacterium]
MRNNNSLLAVSALLGAILGLAAGVLLLRRAEQRGSEVAITSGEGLSIGLLAFGLLRQIATLGDE